MRHLLAEAGLGGAIHVDSAGTAAYHTGERPDRRSAAAARARGIDLPGRARQFTREDWDEFDYVLAMDADNHAELARRAPNAAARAKLHLFRDFDPASPRGSSTPDPYYGGANGFEEVLDICEAACQGLLVRLRADHGI